MFTLFYGNNSNCVRSKDQINTSLLLKRICNGMIGMHGNIKKKGGTIFVQKKKITTTLTVIALGLSTCLLLTGCGKKAELENNHTVVKFEKGKISADSLYESLKNKYGISVLVDLIDHQLFDAKYKTDDKEKESIDSQVEQMKSQYNGDEEQFKAAISQYLGVKDEEELRSLLSLEYKRNLAIEEAIKDGIKDDEIKKYYDDEVVGDMKVRHILIKPETTDDMSTEEKEDAEKKAKKEAEDIIKKLDKGEDFEKLAKKHSDDTGSASDGGLIDYFNKDSNMDEAFTNASIELEKGKYTKEPVKSSFGYHIILKVDQKKKEKLDKVKDTIVETLMNEKLSNDSTLRYETLKAVRSDAGMTFEDDQLKKEYDELMDKLIANAKNASTAS